MAHGGAAAGFGSAGFYDNDRFFLSNAFHHFHKMPAAFDFFQIKGYHVCFVIVFQIFQIVGGGPVQAVAEADEFGNAQPLFFGPIHKNAANGTALGDESHIAFKRGGFQGAAEVVMSVQQTGAVGPHKTNTVFLGDCQCFGFGVMVAGFTKAGSNDDGSFNAAFAAVFHGGGYGRHRAGENSQVHSIFYIAYAGIPRAVAHAHAFGVDGVYFIESALYQAGGDDISQFPRAGRAHNGNALRGE